MRHNNQSAWESRAAAIKDNTKTKQNKKTTYELRQHKTCRKVTKDYKNGRAATYPINNTHKQNLRNIHIQILVAKYIQTFVCSYTLPTQVL